MRISPNALKAIKLDPQLSKCLMSGNVAGIVAEDNFRKENGVLVCNNEPVKNGGLIDFRTITGTNEQIEQRYFECLEEIKKFGTPFIRQMLSQHQSMVESRSDFTVKQKAAHRKMIIGMWHNVKIVRKIEIEEDDSNQTKSKQN